MSNASRQILIADDHAVVRRGLRALLETRPNLHIAAEASDGRTALELARSTQPDIAVIDYSLPELGGPDLIAALLREVPRVEVLVYTVHDREELVLEALRADARGYVLKSDTEKHLLPRSTPCRSTGPISGARFRTRCWNISSGRRSSRRRH